MIPIHELISRIRWDAAYGAADFVIGYYDRVARCVVHVPLRQIAFPPDEHFSFVVIDDEGLSHTVPYHRIRELHRDGVLVWSRHPPQTGI